MSDGFVKIYSSILDSSIWSEAYPTRLVWIALLAMADAGGVVKAAISGIARRAAVTREECEAALATLMAPDPDDQSGVDDGIRLRKIEHGWRITNYERYRNGRDPDKRREQNREAQARWRESHKTTVSPSKPASAKAKPESAHAEADAEAEEEKGLRPSLVARISNPKPDASPIRGPADFKPDPGLLSAQATKHGVTVAQLLRLLPEFVHYWAQGDGARKRRALRGWSNTWKKHVDAQAERGRIPADGGYDQGPPTHVRDCSDMSDEEFARTYS